MLGYSLRHAKKSNITTILYRQTPGFNFERFSHGLWIRDDELGRHTVVGGTTHQGITNSAAKKLIAKLRGTLTLTVWCLTISSEARIPPALDPRLSQTLLGTARAQS